MKIMHVIDSGGLYGAEVMLLNLAKEQKSSGLEPLIVSIGLPDEAPKPLEKEALKRKLPLQAVRFRAGLNVYGALGILSKAKKENCSIIHSHGYKGNILFGLLPRNVRKLPMVTTLHGWTSAGGLTKMRIYEWLDAFSLNRIDRIVFVNNQMAAHPRLGRLNKKKTSVIYNGICCQKNNDATIDRALKNYIQQRYTVVCVGRFSREKNIQVAITAIAELVAKGCDIQLLLLGDGRLREQIAKQVNDLHITERVMMPGHVENVGAYLELCQLFVMPSLTEGLPMALLEAMHAGIPIIASRVGGIPDVLLEGKAGILIPPGDTASLLEQLQLHYQHPRKYTDSIEIAKKCVVANYSSFAMAEAYCQIYKELSGEKGPIR